MTVLPFVIRIKDYQIINTNFKKVVIHMKRAKYYGAVDVDDSHFNVALIDSRNNELLHFKCSSNVGAMIKKIKQKDIKLCYEAIYLGYTLFRELKSKGIRCEVIAPSLIPKTPGKKVFFLYGHISFSVHTIGRRFIA